MYIAALPNTKELGTQVDPLIVLLLAKKGKKMFTTLACFMLINSGSKQKKKIGIFFLIYIQTY